MKFLIVCKSVYILYNIFMEEIQEKVREFADSNGFSQIIKFNEQMAPKTSFKIGGKAAVFAEPEDFMQLVRILQFARSEKISFFVLGGASNVVFCDELYNGIVISLLKFNEIAQLPLSEDEVLVSCGAGTTMAQLVNFCTKNRLEGMEPFAGLPGTVGGALFMNARCFELSISERFYSARFFDLDDFTPSELNYIPEQWDYKVSPFQNSTKIILSAFFKLKKSSKSEEEIASLCKSFIEERKSKGHFKYPSAGSVFKNNRDFGSPSGKIIDECGLKGVRVGNAQIAPFHGNFIINLGGATQKDVKKLVEMTVNKVRELKGLSLETEIIFVEADKSFN